MIITQCKDLCKMKIISYFKIYNKTYSLNKIITQLWGWNNSTISLLPNISSLTQLLEQDGCTPPKCGDLSHIPIKGCSSFIYCKAWRQESKVKFVLFNDATGTHWFLSYHRLLDVIHMVTLTHLLEGNPLPPHRLLFSISSKGSFICTFP